MPMPAARNALRFAPWLCACLLPAMLAAGEAPGSRLGKVIDLDLWGKHLGEAVSQVTERSSVDLVVDPAFIRPKEFPRHKLYLRATRVTTRTAIEMLARALGCRYRVTGPAAVLLSDGYSWLNERQRVLIPRFSLDSLLAPGESARSLENVLAELVKPNFLLGDSCCLRVEQTYVGEKETTKQLVAVLPATLRDLLRQALTAMTKPGRPLRAPATPATRAGEAELLARLRKPVVLHCRAWTVEQVVRDLCLQADINLAFDHRPWRERPPGRITLNLGEVSARQAIEALGRKLGLAGCEYLSARCVWLSATPRRWTRAWTREFMWEQLVFRSYAAAGVARKLGSGELLAHHLRRTVLPEAWLDPALGVAYHRRSGNLLVVAPPLVQQRVLVELARLRRSKTGKERRP